MRFICIFALFLSVHLYSSNDNTALEVKRPENIRVLLEKDISGAVLEVKGPYYIFNPEDGSRISSGLLGKRFLVHGLQNGIKWGEQFPGIHQVYIVPRSEETSILVNGIQYEGAIAVFQIEDKISIVNDIDIEKYIKAILTPKFPFPLETEVMAAVAILARTNAYYYVSKGGLHSFWDVDAKDVGFQGCALVDSSSFITKGVDSTKNLIMIHPYQGKNVPFAAKWTEHSAGKTAPFRSIFRFDGHAPNLSISTPHAELDKDDTKWSFIISKIKLAKLLNVSNIDKLELFTDKDSNKIYGARVINGSEKKDFNFIDLQNRLNKDLLKSSEFTISQAAESITFTGFGSGHGVGLCLHSAAALAQNGDNAVQILARFFPQTYLMNLSALPNRQGNIVENLNERNLFTR
ncbi:MAG: hypothetical protein COT84_01300 [Chlamydiae bacterium CG10_big_fil_rev_8_21_14_0_10_35_9]|nr:MAG: hypothetical protein COT84_01300 [Chlamydiae bacterium CG10_big_fil_rev_8_21_14_0_10_35_9]